MTRSGAGSRIRDGRFDIKDLEDISSVINPDASIRRLTIGREGGVILVIDNLLRAPGALVEQAAQARFAAVRQADNYYPGLRAPAPEDYARGLTAFVRPLIAEHLGVATDTLAQARCAFSIAALPPEKLTPAQSLPHFDTADDRQIAAVHYLCDSRHGGTAFYRHRKTGFEAIARDRVEIYFDTLKQELRAQGAPTPAYVTQSGPLFEQTHAVEAQFDRIVVYKSNLLHSGMVNAETLSPDPHNGRLTATLFARFQ